MTNGLMSRYNMAGQRGEKKFSDEKSIVELIGRAVLGNFPNSTHNEIEKYMGIVFKQAPARAGGARKTAVEEDHVVEDDIGAVKDVGVVDDDVVDDDVDFC